jgi:hypothetical protein
MRSDRRQDPGPTRPKPAWLAPLAAAALAAAVAAPGSAAARSGSRAERPSGIERAFDSLVDALSGPPQRHRPAARRGRKHGRAKPVRPPLPEARPAMAHAAPAAGALVPLPAVPVARPAAETVAMLPPAATAPVEPPIAVPAAAPESVADAVVPLPKPRPAASTAVAALTPPAAGPPAPDPDCAALALGGNAEFDREPPIAAGICGADAPVLVRAIRLDDGRRVALQPPATMRCAAAATLVDWLKRDVAPKAEAAYGEPVAALEVAGSYECRSRNRVPGAKLSEHARANAVDVRGFRLASGKEVAVKDQAPFVTAVRKDACGPFTTVLGPGADPAHADHLHLDLEVRGRNGHALFCQ